MLPETTPLIDRSNLLPWHGRRSHAGNTWVWLQSIKAQAKQWSKQGLSDQAIVDLVNALPTLAREKPEVFQASAQLLLTQSPDKTWQRAMNLRLAVVRRAVEINRAKRLVGDQLALQRRNDAWVAIQEKTGAWTINNGRHLSHFISRGGRERGLFWSELSKLPGLIEIETPTKHMGYAGWQNSIHKAARLLFEHPIFQLARNKNRTWKLAIRRVKRLGIRGLYDHSTQTIIVDPRHPETLLHELGHWVLEHNQMTAHTQAENEVEELILSFKKYF